MITQGRLTRHEVLCNNKWFIERYDLPTVIFAYCGNKPKTAVLRRYSSPCRAVFCARASPAHWCSWALHTPKPMIYLLLRIYGVSYWGIFEALKTHPAAWKARSSDCKRALLWAITVGFSSANKASSCVCSSLIIELSKWYRVCIDAVTLNKVINFCPFNGTPPCRFCGCVLRCQLCQSIEFLFVKWAIAGESRRTSTWRLISRYANLYPLVGSAAPQTLHTLGNTRVQGNYKKWTEDYVMGSNALLI